MERGVALQPWLAHHAIAARIVQTAGSDPDSYAAVVSCANAHASLLGLRPRFAAAMASYARDPRPRPWLVYRLSRGAAVGVGAIGAPQWLVERQLHTLTSARRWCRQMWMNFELFEREGAAPCLPVGILRDGGAGRLPTLDRSGRSPRRTTPPVNRAQLALSL